MVGFPPTHTHTHTCKSASNPPPPPPHHHPPTHPPRIQVTGKLLDIVGTGGDGAHTINISTAAIVLAAACGAKAAKLGNRSVSSQCGEWEWEWARPPAADKTPTRKSKQNKSKQNKTPTHKPIIKPTNHQARPTCWRPWASTWS